MKSQANNLIVDLSFAFAIEIIAFCELLESKKKYNLANQLFRSATSIGANVYESQHAESRADFIHKLKISSKKQTRRDIGCYYARIQKIIRTQINY